MTIFFDQNLHLNCIQGHAGILYLSFIFIFKLDGIGKNMYIYL